jgi:folate-binding protein YgfZ
MNGQPAARFHLPGAGVLLVSGADRIDFLQRQSTNDLTRITPGFHLSTVLTNAAARVLDVLQVFVFNDETLAVVTLPDRGERTAGFLKKRVFFNDRVTVEDAGGAFRVVDLIGPAAMAALPEGIRPVGEGMVERTEFAGEAVHLLGGKDGGQRLIVPVEVAAGLEQALEEAGIRRIPADEFEILRVEAGLPGPAGELTEEYTPLETGLGDLISDTKGCYTGQEVIARQITYDKITRGLAGIRLDGPAVPGDRVLAGDAGVGSVTSYVHSPREGHLALAVLRRPHLEPGTQVQVEVGEWLVGGRVVRLPFTR